MRSVAAAIFILCVISPVFPQRFDSVRADVNKREYLAALAELKLLETSDPDSFTANNFDYLSARLHYRTGDSGRAAEYFQSVRSRGSILREYATWHLSVIAREHGNLLGERIMLLELLADRPASILADAAQQRLARSYFESKNYDETIAAISGMPGRSSGSRPRDIELLHAKALLFKGDAARARIKFEAIIASTANPAQPDDLALEAVRALDLIEIGSEKLGKETAKLSDIEHQNRATIYQFNRDFLNARLHLLTILNDHPTSGIVPNALYQIGRGYSQTSNFTEAVKWYERIGEQHPEHPVSKDALLQLASGYARLGKHRESVARYERYIQNYPNDERIDRAYLNIVDVLRDAGEETEALSRAERAADAMRGKVGEAQALFVQARIRIARNEWDAALADLDKLLKLNDLGGTSVPGATTKAEVTFLRGIVFEELRQYSDAIRTYLSISDGRNEYYGWRATERIRAMANVPEARSAIDTALNGYVLSAEPGDRHRQINDLLRIRTEPDQRAKLLDDLRKTYGGLPAYKLPAIPKFVEVGRNELRTKAAPERNSKTIAEELAFLGLYDEAAPAYEASLLSATRKQPGDPEYALARMYLRGDRADRAVVYAESNFKLPNDFQPELIPRELADMLYPQPYADLLTKHAAPRNVDPYFVLSIMRQESRFQPNVKSVAAARGLMQFIPDTSNKIAGELGRERFDQNELYVPSTAILFGSQYIGNLFKLFPNQPDAVAASYNGGEDNMQRWYGRAKTDQPGRYVPEIAFAQSKDYVWRVMANYRMYNLLYGN